ncbi:MAG: NAD(P)H-hydrate epimerase, partial [Methanoregula sp.]|nr:NAD(P)H-hydrate epimerase [Methanoregula sp.]
MFPETGLITPERMRVVDANAMALGVTELQLMESAGRGLAEIVLTAHPDRVLFLCGKGNNGGDGMVAARHLRRHAATDVCYLDSARRSSACEHQLRALTHSRIGLHPFASRDDLESLRPLFGHADAIVDCLLGTGVSGTVTEPLMTCITMVNMSRATVIAADIPTPGMRADRICA